MLSSRGTPVIRTIWRPYRKPPTLLKPLLVLVSILPLALLVKSLHFKRTAGAKVTVSNFGRQVGYLATGIAAVLGAATLYHFVNSWLR
jgi:hypothetical protein